MLSLRIRWTKQGRIRFTSHRDVARIWERGVRKAGLPVVYSQGFVPRQRLSFGLALAVGQESEAEYLDIQTNLPPVQESAIHNAELRHRLSNALPEGMEVVAAAALEPGEPSLQELVSSCTWEIDLGEDSRQAWQEDIGRLLGAVELPIVRERKGKRREDDVRPAIIGIRMADAQRGCQRVCRLIVELAVKPRALRPNEFLALTHAPISATRLVRRTHQWIKRNGKKYEPLAMVSDVSEGFAQHHSAVPLARKEVCA